MAPYSLKQKIFIVKRYYQCGNSAEKVQNEFPFEFTRSKSPTNDMIIELVQLFEEFGSVFKYHKRRTNDTLLDNTGIKNESELHEWNTYHHDENYVEIKTEPEIFAHEFTPYLDDDGDPHQLDSLNDYVKDENSTIDKCSSESSDSDDADDDDEDEEEHKDVDRDWIKGETITSGAMEQSNSSFLKNQTIDNNDDMNKKLLDEILTRAANEKEGTMVADGEETNTSFKCGVCKKSFNRRRTYTKHMNSHKNSCEICGIKYRDYAKHMRKHTGEKPYQCAVCSAQFVDMSRLNSHMTTHSDARPFECETCKKTFKSRERLHGHMKIHLSDRPIKCDICGKGFLHNGDLKKHSRVHTGEKPYVCSYCGKCFASSHSLTVHNRIHTGEKPYKCCYCDKQFNVAGSLNIHKRIHTGEKPYKCKFCEKAFYDTATCRVHERTHTGDYPYKCVLCGKAHNHPSNLKSHMRHAHREDQG